MQLERELKLSAPADFVLPDLSDALPGAAMTALPPTRLTTTYWDTPDLRLSRAGVSLRHRAEDGKAPVWTVKLATGTAKAVLERGEVDFEGEAGKVPEQAANLVLAYTRKARLEEVSVLESRRVRLELRDGRGRRLAEIDDDAVSVVDRSRVTDRFRELEVELGPEASESVAETVVHRLQDAGAGDTGRRSKVSRALGPGAMEPPDFEGPAVDRESGAGAWFKAVVAGGVARLVRHDAGVRLAEDPEELHQARVAVRRLRSDLRLLSPLVDQKWVDGLRSELDWVAAPLGRARDADVLIQRLWHHVELLSRDDLEPATHLLEVLATSRVRLQEELRDMLDSPRYLGVLDVLIRAVQDPVLSDAASSPAAEVAPVLVGRTWKTLAKRARAVRRGQWSETRDQQLHRVRIAAKRCRYGCEAASLIVGRPAARMARAVSRVQDVLGELQDAVVAEQWLRQTSTGQLSSRQAVVVGEMIAYERFMAEERRRQWEEVWVQASKKKLRSWLG